MLLGDGPVNDRILFFKVSILSEFLIFQSYLFHSVIVEGKVFLKKLSFTFFIGNLLHCLSLYDILCVGAFEQRLFGD